MIPKLDNAAKHPVTPSSWKPSTDPSVSPTNSDFTPAETPPKSSGSAHQSIEDINATGMEETIEGATSKQQGKPPESEDTKAKEDASPPKPDIPSASKESTSINPKSKKATCKKHAKKKTKKHSKAAKADSSSDSDESSSDSSSSSSSGDPSDSSTEDDEAAKKKRKSKAKKARKLKAKKRAKAKAKAEDTDSDSDDESSSSEEEKKKSKMRKQLKKKKRAKKSKEVEEEDDEEADEDDDDDEDAALRQQVAQVRALNLKRVGKGRAGRGTVGETVNISGELGKKSAKAKAKPGKRSVFRKLSSIRWQKSGLQFSLFATSITNRLFRSRKRKYSSQSSSKMPPWVNFIECYFCFSAL